MPPDAEKKFEFCNDIIGNAIPPNFIAACEKGFTEAVRKGPLVECPVWGVRVVLTDGATHVVDSSELAFKIACKYAFKQAFMRAEPVLIEPIMDVEITIPSEFQGAVLGSINKRRGAIKSTGGNIGSTIIYAEVPLAEMFGYSTELRSLTQGQGEYSMEYAKHTPVPADVQAQILAEREQEEAKKKK